MSAPHVALPLLEYDAADQQSVLEPRPVVTDGVFPRRVVLCYFHDVMAELANRGVLTPIGQFSPEISGHTVFRHGVGASAVAVFHPGMGGALAANHMERAIASGGAFFLACGSAGSLLPDLTMGAVVVPSAAIRDEGTSFHFAAPSREIAAQPGPTAVASEVLRRHDVPAVSAKTWTTDAPFRETQLKVQRRRGEGCAVVEMEAAALMPSPPSGAWLLRSTCTRRTT